LAYVVVISVEKICQKSGSCCLAVPEMRASLWLARNFFFGPVKN
jgi:hypothetical protein